MAVSPTSSIRCLNKGQGFRQTKLLLDAFRVTRPGPKGMKELSDRRLGLLCFRAVTAQTGCTPGVRLREEEEGIREEVGCACLVYPMAHGTWVAVLHGESLSDVRFFNAKWIVGCVQNGLLVAVAPKTEVAVRHGSPEVF